MDKLSLNNEMLQDLLNDFYTAIPKILGVLAFFIVAWILFRIIMMVMKRVLKLIRLNKLSNKLNEIDVFEENNFKIDLTKIILLLVKWLIILIFIIVGADILNLTMVSTEVAKIISFLPNLFSAMAILIVGIMLGNFLKKTVQTMLKSFDMSGSKSLGNIVFFIIVLFATITAVNQLGINTDIITNNLLIVLGAFLLAFSIALGLGSREVVLRLILGFYTRKNLAVGMRVRIDGVEGTVVGIDNITFVLDTGSKKIVYPIKEINDKQVEILS